LKISVEKKCFFYKQLHTLFQSHGIITPHPYYVAIDDYGDRSIFFSLLGFKSGFRAVIMMQDLGNYQTLPLGTNIDENTATVVLKKLAQFHALNWYSPLHPALPTYKPEIYCHMFNLSKYLLLPKCPKPETISKSIKLWENKYLYLKDPQNQAVILSYSAQSKQLLKYETNDIPSSGPLFQHHTFLHGDLHPANIFVISEPSPENPHLKTIKDIILVDWQGFGYGHPSTEVSYLLANVDFAPDRDLRLLKVYYEELTKTVSPQEYPWWVFQREVEIRSMEMIVHAFNNILYFKPETILKLDEFIKRRGVSLDNLIHTFGLKFMRFRYIVQKWNHEKIFDRIEDGKD
jgi:thiamine kinase-like enzyme